MEQKILEQAVSNLRIHSEIEANFELNGDLDGLLVLNLKHSPPKRYYIEIKKEIRGHHIGHLLELKKKYRNFLLVAQKLSPNLKERLREEGIFYLEGNGNIYILEDGLFVQIDSNKPLDLNEETGNRAFTKTGLKLLLQFLVEEDLINENQRSISKKTEISLGAVSQTLTGLLEAGFLIKNKRTYLWMNRKELLAKWISAYESLLKPSLFKGRYQFKKDWKNLELNQEESQWGGEPAGDLLTGYLRPEEFILFSNETKTNLIRNYQLVPDSDGEVFVYEKFWRGKPEKWAPAVLVYADLLLTGDQRCRETAEKIYDEYIGPNL